MHRLLRYLAVLASLGMFIVLAMGALVTNTGSGYGCGKTWPLCNGEVIPQLSSLSVRQVTFVEFSHRAVTGVETVFVLMLTVGTWLLYRQRREARWLVPAMIAFLFLQSVLGAIAAGTHETAAILALHFGISLISFASIVLTTAFLFEMRGGDVVRDRPVVALLRPLVWGTLAYTYVVVYMGAYVQHTRASVACTDWPLCRDQMLPSLGSPYGLLVNFTHRFAAGLLVLLVMWLWANAWGSRKSRPDIYRGATAALVSVFLQVASGAFVVFSIVGVRIDLRAALFHAVLVSLLFASLCYIAYHLVPRRICVPRPMPIAGRQSAIR